jgi:hypothetical protein
MESVWNDILTILASLIMVAIILAAAFGIWWVIAWLLVQMLGFFGVPGFPRDFPLWLPLALAVVTGILRSIFSKNVEVKK